MSASLCCFRPVFNNFVVIFGFGVCLPSRWVKVVFKIIIKYLFLSQKPHATFDKAQQIEIFFPDVVFEVQSWRFHAPFEFSSAFVPNWFLNQTRDPKHVRQFDNLNEIAAKTTEVPKHKWFKGFDDSSHSLCRKTIQSKRYYFFGIASKKCGSIILFIISYTNRDQNKSIKILFFFFLIVFLCIFSISLLV